MATQARRVDWPGLIAFAIVVALFFLVGPRFAVRAFGAWMVLTAGYQQWSGKLPVNWEGEAPSRTTVAVMNFIVGVLGLSIAIWPDGIMGLFGMA